MLVGHEWRWTTQLKTTVNTVNPATGQMLTVAPGGPRSGLAPAVRSGAPAGAGPFVLAVSVGTPLGAAVERYANEQDLTETLSMHPDLAGPVAQLLLGEDWMLAGGSGDPAGDWERRIDEHILPLLHARSLSDYLLIEGQRFWSQPTTHDLGAPAQLLDMPADEPAAEPPSGPALRVRELHPAIAKAAELLAAEAYDSAVREAALAFRDLLREHSGRHDLDGIDLAGAALGGPQPPIVLADLQTPDGRSEQKGWLTGPRRRRPVRRAARDKRVA